MTGQSFSLFRNNCPVRFCPQNRLSRLRTTQYAGCRRGTGGTARPCLRTAFNPGYIEAWINRRAARCLRGNRLAKSRPCRYCAIAVVDRDHGCAMQIGYPGNRRSRAWIILMKYPRPKYASAPVFRRGYERR